MDDVAGLEARARLMGTQTRVEDYRSSQVTYRTALRDSASLMGPWFRLLEALVKSMHINLGLWMS